MIDAPIIAGAWIERRLKGRTRLARRVYYAFVKQKTTTEGATVIDDSRFPAIVYQDMAASSPGRRAGSAGDYITFQVRVTVSENNGPGSVQDVLKQIQENLTNADGRPLEDTEQGCLIRSWFERSLPTRPEPGPGGVIYYHPGALFRIQVTPLT